MTTWDSGTSYWFRNWLSQIRPLCWLLHISPWQSASLKKQKWEGTLLQTQVRCTSFYADRSLQRALFCRKWNRGYTVLGARVKCMIPIAVASLPTPLLSCGKHLCPHPHGIFFCCCSTKVSNRIVPKLRTQMKHSETRHWWVIPQKTAHFPPPYHSSKLLYNYSWIRGLGFCFLSVFYRSAQNLPIFQLPNQNLPVLLKDATITFFQIWNFAT